MVNPCPLKTVPLGDRNGEVLAMSYQDWSADPNLHKDLYMLVILALGRRRRQIPSPGCSASLAYFMKPRPLRLHCLRAKMAGT